MRVERDRGGADMKLSGVRVVDLSQFMPGPLMCGTMADHGADVIKLEALTGDPFRRDPSDEGIPPTGAFVAVNRGKRSIALDLKHAAGREAALRLLDTADVVVEAFRPGVAARLGIDYASLRQRNPRVVYCSLSAFGQTGPLATTAAHDMVIQAMAGSLPIDSRKVPLTNGASMAASVSAFTALSGVLMALLRARETGIGDWLDLSMHDATLNAQPVQAGPALRGDAPADLAYAMLEAYQTADDQWLCLGGRERPSAANLLTPLGRPDLIDNATGKAPQAPLREFLQATFRSRSRDAWLTWCEGRAISIAPVLSYSQALRHPHTVARAMVLHDDKGDAHLATPIKFANEPGVPRLVTPRVGADGPAILVELGYDAAQIAELEQCGVTLPATPTSI
jgi:crotonobetainyl-CoA:carnitine CoA-transferase CaiB-like acyl-CoA transferase